MRYNSQTPLLDSAEAFVKAKLHFRRVLDGSNPMNHSLTAKKQRLNYLLTTLWENKVLWIAPAILGFVLAAAYAFLLRPETWTARQSFTVRDDTLGQAFKPGRFESQESLQSAQETILEVARRPSVVRNVLEKLGPISGWNGENWITDELIEETQDDINFSAPNGAEFGTTEAIVLTAKASSRDRSRKFIELLSEEVIAQVNRVRSLRLASMEQELEQAYNGAAESQQEAMNRLAELDERLTPEFGVINSFNDGRNQNSPAEQEIADIKTELRQKKAELEKAETILLALHRAAESPEDSDLSSSVLKELTSLDKMYDDLAKFRNDLAIAQGNFRDRYGPVQTLKYAIDIQQKGIRKELSSEISGVQADIAMFNKQIETKANQIETLESRLIELSKYRAEYLSLFAQVRELTDAALRAKTTWRKTKSLAESASSVGLMTPMDVAQVSSRPDGVGKKVFVLAGVLGGLMIGIGLVLLLAPGMDDDLAHEHNGSPEPLPPMGSGTNSSNSRPESRPVPSPTTHTDYSSPLTASLGTKQPSAAPVSPVSAAKATALAASQLPMTERANSPMPTATTANKPVQVKPVQQAKHHEKAPTDSLKRDDTAQPYKARPVDLIKSAQQDDGFVQVKPVEKADAAPVKKATTQPTFTSETPAGQPPKAKAKSSPRKDNPFLRAVAKSEPTETKSTDTTNIPDLSKTGRQKSDDSKRDVPLTIPMPPSALRTSEPTIEMDQMPNGVGTTEGGIPEQIRKLAESIQQFGSTNSAE